MAAPMSLQQQSRSHPFRSHSSYSNDIYTMSPPPSKGRNDSSMSPRIRRDDRLRSQRQFPVQQYDTDNPDPNAPLDDRSRNAPSSDRGFVEPARPQGRADRPAPMYPAHPVPQQLGPPSRSHEVSISNLVNAPTPSAFPPRAREMHRSPSPTDVRQNDGSSTRLPGIQQLMGNHPDDRLDDHRGGYPPAHAEPMGAPQFQTPQYHRPEQQDLPGLAPSNHHGRAAGHSAASSLSSMYSEPTSPQSYNGHSYSPPPPHQRYVPPHHAAHAIAQCYDPYPPAHREDPAQMYPNPRYPSAGQPPAAAYATPYQQPYSAPYPPQHQLPYQQPPQYQAPYPPPHHARPSMDIYGQMPRPPPPNQQPLPEYGLVPGAYPHGSSGHPQELRNDSVMGSAYSYGFPSHSYPLPRKRRGNLPKDATKVMKEWFGKHKDSPYPTEEQKQELVRLTRLNMSQVNNWFINARRRQPRREAESIIEEQRERGATEHSEDSFSNEATPYGHRTPPTQHQEGPPAFGYLPYRPRPQEDEDEAIRRRGQHPPPPPPPAV
ncbi:hypothetical protein EG328_007814 [Venturia inaequalis]|uniref:Homeobox domain-containing protein n=1 Tax=Venturia inaequalis TaxID=5025 RepID=A0A8H3ZC81_VENIN|nr:hypothetical protein EG328_007814 [Venturia inaequalis]KAE9990908.1 hypothetical protein EG327_000789 [Venturia inaequalis]